MRFDHICGITIDMKRNRLDIWLLTTAKESDNIGCETGCDFFGPTAFSVVMSEVNVAKLATNILRVPWNNNIKVPS